MDVYQTIVKVFEEIGVDHVFGGSGQVNASMLLALNKSDKIKTVIIQNEQAASFMAAGYGMFSKKLGVCFGTGGPGAFNLFSGLAVAYSDSIPMLAISGYPSRWTRGKGALNETSGISRTPDSQTMFAATTKKSIVLEDAKDTIPVLEELIYTAFEGRPGPVHLHIPKDISFAEVPYYRPIDISVPKILAGASQTEEFCKGFVENFKAENKPLLMVGYGCIRSEAKDVLEKLINTWQIPFVSTMDAKGYISEDNPLSLGIVGTSGDVGANDYFHESKMIIAVGNSFAENATFTFKPTLMDGKKLFHINIDRHEISKVYPADYRLISDAKPALESLAAYLEQNKVPALPKLAQRNKYHDEQIPEFSNGKLHPAYLTKLISKHLPENAIIMGDAGGHMLWLSAYLNLNKNQWYQNPGSFGPMASHVNGSIGVKCANPNRPVICGCGDGEYNFYGGDVFDKSKCLLDPYAKLVSGRNIWGVEPDWNNPFQYRSKVILDDFDWEGDVPLKTPRNELIIYEAHVRGFTKDESSGVKYKGTYAGLAEKIPYLKELGITALELLPIFEFDEFEGAREVNGNKLFNYWGYSTVGFFAPKAGYAASGKYSMQADELKTLIKELHNNGIKVILDVVFNHTAEGNEHGPYISFKGLDNKIYYILTPDGYYYNFSGCGNTLNCNNPVVRNLILDCLRYWVGTYHVDGFRFDLAAILGRNQDGSPMSNPPLLESLAHDPILKDVILIAEAWDAGGLYQVGHFPSYGRWAEWNGKYRDDVRRFLKGDSGLAEHFARRIAGSEDIYDRYWRGDCASVNFITCHDGFTLYDLFAYNDKHNEANGWGGSDGGNDNHSWNCGWEGDYDLPDDIKYLRHKMIKNAAAILLTSVGIPMILAGDEFGNTQYGNNNPYCQDNKISWLDWNDLQKNQDLYQFFKKMIAFRKNHPVLMRTSPATPIGYPAISIHGTEAWNFDSSAENRVVGIMFTGKTREGKDDFVYIGVNAHWDAHEIWLPALPQNVSWKITVNTDLGDNAFYDEPITLETSQKFLIGPRSVIICTN